VYRADFETRREAATWEIEKRKELETERARTPEPIGMDLVSFCNNYLDYARLRFVKNTYDNKKRLCNRLLEYLGNMPAADVTPEMIHSYLMDCAAKISTGRFNEDYKHIRALWQWGVDILGFDGNPAAKIRRLPHNRAPQYTPSTSDLLKVLAACTREDRIFLSCYLNTAARRSEIFRWTWNEDVNFEKREVRLGTRKTRDGSMSYEWLPMSDALHEDLWSWWQNRPVKDSPYVFVSTSNRHYGQPYQWRRRFMKGLCKRAGVKEFGFHALRRYVASVLADTHKISAKTIQRILRHKAVSTTERYIQNINHDLSGVLNLLGKKSTHSKHPTASAES